MNATHHCQLQHHVKSSLRTSIIYMYLKLVDKWTKHYGQCIRERAEKTAPGPNYGSNQHLYRLHCDVLLCRSSCLFPVPQISPSYVARQSCLYAAMFDDFFTRDLRWCHSSWKYAIPHRCYQSTGPEREKVHRTAKELPAEHRGTIPPSFV